MALFEQRAGYLDVEDCVRAAAVRPSPRGAVVAELAKMFAVGGLTGRGVFVETDRGTYRAASLIISAGAWAGTLLADLGIRFRGDCANRSTGTPLRNDFIRRSHGFPGFLYRDGRTAAFTVFPASTSTG